MAEQENFREKYWQLLKSGITVKIQLTPGGESPNILKAKLYQQSEYFRGLFACSAANDEVQPIHLDDVSPYTLESVICFLYDRQIYSDAPDEPQESVQLIPHLVDVCLFADKYDFLRLRNHCIWGMLGILETHKFCINELSSDILAALSKAFTRLPLTAKMYELLLFWLSNEIVGPTAKINAEGFDSLVAVLPHPIIVAILRHRALNDHILADEWMGDLKRWFEVEKDLGM